MAGIIRYFLVPDVDGVLEYADLPDVDPNTLEPSESAVPAWDAVVSVVAGYQASAAASAAAAAGAVASAEAAMGQPAGW